MQLRRSALYWAKGNKVRIETLAFLVMLKKHSVQSTINNFSVNKVSSITGCSWATCKKYIALLVDLELVDFNGEKNLLTIRRISSGTKHRNLCIDGIDFRKLKLAKDSIRHLIHMLSLSARHTVKKAIRIANNPKNWMKEGYFDNRNAALQFCKKFVDQNAETGKYEYKELGVSYKTIAKEFGCCAMTAFRIIKDGIHAHLFTKHKHYEYKKLDYGMLKEHENYGEMFGYTFITKKGYGFKVGANSYELVKETRDPLFEKFRKHDFQNPMTEDEYDELVRRKKEKEEKFKELYRSKACELYRLSDYRLDEIYSWRLSLKKLSQKVREGRCRQQPAKDATKDYALVQY